MVKKSKVIGVIYPLPESLIRRIFEKKKNIFVKFTTHEPTKKTKMRLRDGIKLYIYQPRFEKTIVADAIICKYEYLNIKEVLKNYREKLIISKKELEEYSRGRELKKLLVLHLKDLRKYKQPVRMKKPITMAGQYVTLDNQDTLFK